MCTVFSLHQQRILPYGKANPHAAHIDTVGGGRLRGARAQTISVPSDASMQEGVEVPRSVAVWSENTKKREMQKHAALLPASYKAFQKRIAYPKRKQKYVVQSRFFHDFSSNRHAVNVGPRVRRIGGNIALLFRCIEGFPLLIIGHNLWKLKKTEQLGRGRRRYRHG